jgi:hypothetical protein
MLWAQIRMPIAIEKVFNDIGKRFLFTEWMQPIFFIYIKRNQVCHMEIKRSNGQVGGERFQGRKATLSEPNAAIVPKNLHSIHSTG